MVAGCKAKQKRDVFRLEQMPPLRTVREVSREHVARRRHPPAGFPCWAHAGRGEIVATLRSGPISGRGFGLDHSVPTASENLRLGQPGVHQDRLRQRTRFFVAERRSSLLGRGALVVMTKAPLFSHRRAGRRCALRPFRDRLTDDSRGSGSQRQAEPTRLGAQVSSLRGSTRPFLERLIQIKRSPVVPPRLVPARARGTHQRHSDGHEPGRRGAEHPGLSVPTSQERQSHRCT
jgi:hypothetical protein